MKKMDERSQSPTPRLGSVALVAFAVSGLVGVIFYVLFRDWGVLLIAAGVAVLITGGVAFASRDASGRRARQVIIGVAAGLAVLWGGFLLYLWTRS